MRWPRSMLAVVIGETVLIRETLECSSQLPMRPLMLTDLTKLMP